MKEGIQNPKLKCPLVHSDESGQDTSILSIDWNKEGSKFITCSSDGRGRIWNKDGQIENVLTGHDHGLVCAKWNKKGYALVTVGDDDKIILWNNEGNALRTYVGNKGIVDIDWKNNNEFATCGKDTNIMFWSVGNSKVVQIFDEHTEPVNGIAWDSSGAFLASYSEDSQLKIWTTKQPKSLLTFTTEAP